MLAPYSDSQEKLYYGIKVYLMPTVLKAEGFRFFFYSGEGVEPPHIHVERDNSTAKFWLDPVQLASSRGFRSHQINQLRVLVIEYRERFKEKWDEHFGG